MTKKRVRKLFTFPIDDDLAEGLKLVKQRDGVPSLDGAKVPSHRSKIVPAEAKRQRFLRIFQGLGEPSNKGAQFAVRAPFS